MRLQAIILLAVFSASFTALSAPAPEFLAYDPQTKECMRFFPGDEFTRAKIGNQWKRVMAYGKVDTEFGQCTFSAKPDDFERCCKKLGLKFLDSKSAEKYMKAEPGISAPKSGTKVK